MRRLFTLFATAALVAACSGNGGDSDSDTDTDGGDDAPERCDSTDGESPSILGGTIRCEPPLQDDQPPFLYMEISASDPQGDFTLQRFGDHSLKIYLAANDAMQFDENVITCDSENAGTCSGSISGAQVGVSCGSMDTFYFTATIADDEGNLSPECRLKVE